MLKYDAFISHASEDKYSIVRPIALLLKKKGLKIWYDEFSLKVGDSIRESIDLGLKNSRFGIIIFSKNFIRKKWSIYELNGLTEIDIKRSGVILPIWHNIDKKEMLKFSPPFANKYAIISNGLTNNTIINKLLETLGEDNYSLNNNNKLIKSKKKRILTESDRSLGYYTILSEQTDKIIDTKTTIIKTKLIISPIEKTFSEFEFNHWQDKKGKIELIRINVLEEMTGKIIKNINQITENSGKKMCVTTKFILKEKTPLNIIFEIRTTNYYPNLVKYGNGYTDFHSRYAMDNFHYYCILPKTEFYKNYKVFVNNKKLKMNCNEKEYFSIFKKKNIKIGDRLYALIVKGK